MTKSYSNSRTPIPSPIYANFKVLPRSRLHSLANRHSPAFLSLFLPRKQNIANRRPRVPAPAQLRPAKHLLARRRLGRLLRRGAGAVLVHGGLLALAPGSDFVHVLAFEFFC